jgi:hypothetical protein
MLSEKIDKRNPPTQTFPLGTTLVTVRIRAKDDSLMLYEKWIRVEKIQKVAKKKFLSSSKNSWRVLGFPTPFLQTHNKNVREAGENIVCETTTETCKLNFAFTGGIKGR